MLTINLAEIFAPTQIVMVLVLALVLFGPKRLPELGKQLGTALRELNKAKNDMMKHLSVDHEPDHEPTNYTYPPESRVTQSYSHYSYPQEHVDLTDYTVAGQPPAIRPAEGAVAYGGHAEDATAGAAASADYNLIPKADAVQADAEPHPPSPSPA